MKVYRVVRRRKGSDEEWTQHHTRRGLAVYGNAGAAKGIVTYENRNPSYYEFRVEVTETDWEAL